MRASVINRYGEPSEFTLSEVPKPQIKAGRILVKVLYTSVNPIELLQRAGKFKIPLASGLPRILGSDFSGVVSQVGDGVTSFKPGDKVFGMRSTFEGGAYAEYVSVKPCQLSPMPSNYSFEEAAGLPLVTLTTWQSVVGLAKFKAGQTVLVNGASGGVGVYAVQLIKALGGHVTATCSYRNKALVKSLGADVVLDYTKISILELGQQFDVFYDAYGNFSLGEVEHLLTKSGTYVSTIPNLKNFTNHGISFLSKKKGKVVVVRPNAQQLERIKTMCEEGQIKPIIDSTFDLSEMPQAHEKIRTKRAKGKVVIKVSDI
ncbi:MAG: NAD(P)-dependent alcohol dehydrogenase [Cyclobacteriaceae bacterium]